VPHDRVAFALSALMKRNARHSPGHGLSRHKLLVCIRGKYAILVPRSTFGFGALTSISDASFTGNSEIR
jgi:hypothetical protein